MLIDISPKYEQQMREEIMKKTEILDPAETIKDQAVSKEKENDLKKKFQVGKTFTQIDTDIIEMIG